MWVVVSRSCSDCGGEFSTAVFSHKPSEEEKQVVEQELGGMWCIHSAVIEVELDGQPNREET